MEDSKDFSSEEEENSWEEGQFDDEGVPTHTSKEQIKVENDVKDVRISTLQKIIEVGLGGKLQLSIRL